MGLKWWRWHGRTSMFGVDFSIENVGKSEQQESTMD